MKTSLTQWIGRLSPAQTSNLCLASALLVVGAAQTSLGQAIYRTGFEPPAFAEGTLVGQDGWIAPPPLSPNAATVTRDHPRIGRQTVQVLGEDLEHQDFINAAHYDQFSIKVVHNWQGHGDNE